MLVTFGVVYLCIDTVARSREVKLKKKVQVSILTLRYCSGQSRFFWKNMGPTTLGMDRHVHSTISA